LPSPGHDGGTVEAGHWACFALTLAPDSMHVLCNSSHKVNMKSATLTNISAAQCRAARALLDWSRDQLATESAIALRTIVDFERGARAPRSATLLSIANSLDAAGVIFVDENGEGPGVRLRKAKPRRDG
jgi:DNA-binding XRE family transcriptional regulator